MIKKEKIGEFLIKINAMTEEQCKEVLKLQEEGDSRMFGEIANALGYVDKTAIRKYFRLR